MRQNTRRHRFNPWVDHGKSKQDYTPLSERDDINIEIEVLPTSFDFGSAKPKTMPMANGKPWRGDF